MSGSPEEVSPFDGADVSSAVVTEVAVVVEVSVVTDVSSAVSEVAEVSDADEIPLSDPETDDPSGCELHAQNNRPGTIAAAIKDLILM